MWSTVTTFTIGPLPHKQMIIFTNLIKLKFVVKFWNQILQNILSQMVKFLNYPVQIWLH